MSQTRLRSSSARWASILALMALATALSGFSFSFSSFATGFFFFLPAFDSADSPSAVWLVKEAKHTQSESSNLPQRHRLGQMDRLLVGRAVTRLDSRPHWAVAPQQARLPSSSASFCFSILPAPRVHAWHRHRACLAAVCRNPLLHLQPEREVGH